MRRFSSVFTITERRDIGLYKVALSMSLLGFGMETMLANFHMCGIMLVLRSVFIISLTTPVGPAVFPILNPLIAAAPVWSTNVSDSRFKKIQTAQNAALRTATGLTRWPVMTISTRSPSS